jgi:hypothetical protein
LFWLFRYRFETLPKQTKIFLFLVSRNKPKHNRNRSCFGLFRFEPKFFLFVSRAPYLESISTTRLTESISTMRLTKHLPESIFTKHLSDGISLSVLVTVLCFIFTVFLRLNLFEIGPTTRSTSSVVFRRGFLTVYDRQNEKVFC